MYPREFCRAVCAGIAAQKRIRNLGLTSLPLLSISEMQECVPGNKTTSSPSEDLHEGEMAQNAWSEWQAFDDVSGARLVPEKVAAARRDEIAFV